MIYAAKKQLTAYGPEAQRYADRLPPGTPAIICDGNSVAEALTEAVQRRREDQTYLVGITLLDPVSIVAREVAWQVYTQFPHGDQRREIFESLATKSLSYNGKPIAEHVLYDGQVGGCLREFSQQGDGLIVRSQLERTRLEEAFGRQRTYVAVAPFTDTRVPNVYPDANADQIVVWAPDEQAELLCVYSYAFWDLKRPAVFICRGSIPNTPHRFVDPEHAESALRRASVIVTVHATDPGPALGFADRGFGIVSPFASGSHEYIAGIATYNAWDFTTLTAAVSRARGDRRAFALPRTSSEVLLETIVVAAKPALPLNPPMVSIVVPTYNRRHDIRCSLESFAKTPYPNFEVIVVNDCGEDVSDIVAEFPFARYMCAPVNGGSIKAVNIGLRAAKGEFLGLVADDDIDYPSHIPTLAAALIASNVDVAHSNIVIRCDSKQAEGGYRTIGYFFDHDGHHDAMQVHWSMRIHAQGYLIRRAAFEKLNFLDEKLVCTSDHDTSIRLSRDCDFVHASYVTGEMAYRDDRSNLSSQVGTGLAVEIESMLYSHAPPDSALIRARIEQTVYFVGQAQQMPTFFYPRIPLQESIPLP